MIKPYVIHAKVKNNLLLSRILEEGSSVNEFCIKHKLHPTEIGRFINMRKRAVLADGSWAKLATTLADIFFCSEDDLFTQEQRHAELRSNRAIMELTRQQALQMADPVALLESRQLVQRLLGHSNLTPREGLILKMRYEQDLTLEEAANELSVGSERVRQVETMALNKLHRRYERDETRINMQHAH